MIIGDILKEYPGANSVFQKYFHGACFGCAGMTQETLEEGVTGHGLDLDEVLKELNKTVKSK